jgi:ABC-type transporter Mla MlaB component
MPRESTRQSVRFRIIDRGLDFEIRQQGAIVWVALFGILDRQRLAQLINSLMPLLAQRSRRIVLDGQRLCHIDFRVVTPLIEWSRALKAYDHKLWLAHWSDYLKAILLMEDWERELPLGSSSAAVWPVARSEMVAERLP